MSRNQARSASPMDGTSKRFPMFRNPSIGGLASVPEVTSSVAQPFDQIIEKKANKSNSHHQQQRFVLVKKLSLPDALPAPTVAIPQTSKTGNKLSLDLSEKVGNNQRKLANSVLHQMQQLRRSEIGAAPITENSQQKRNIFQQNHQQSENLLSQYDKGPRFTKEGTLVPYSVVGSPAVYTKLLDRENIRLQQKAQESQYSQSFPKPNRFNRMGSVIELSGTPNASIANNNNNNNNLSSMSSLSHIAPPAQMMQSSSGKSHLFQQQSFILNEQLNDSRMTSNSKQGEMRSSVKRASVSSRSQLNSRGQILPSIPGMKRSMNASQGSELVSKDELLAEMKSAETRINMERALDSSSCRNSVDISQRHFQTRESRILEKHRSIVSKWKNDIASLARKSDRNIADSVMLRSQDYRQKLESVHILEQLRSDDEMFGQRLWYQMLRRTNPSLGKKGKEDSIVSSLSSSQLIGGSTDDPNLMVSRMNIRRIEPVKSQLLQPFHKKIENHTSDIFTNFTTLTSNNYKQDIEFIRQPTLSYDSSLASFQSTQNQQESTTFINRQNSTNSLHKKKHNSSVSDFYTTPIQERIKSIGTSQYPQTWSSGLPEIAEIAIEGKSVYDSELQALQNDGKPMFYKYEKFQVKKQEGTSDSTVTGDNQHILGKSYNIAEMAKLGLLGLKEYS